MVYISFMHNRGEVLFQAQALEPGSELDEGLEWQQVY
jgi:hypothetical protein